MLKRLLVVATMLLPIASASAQIYPGCRFALNNIKRDVRRTIEKFR